MKCRKNVFTACLLLGMSFLCLTGAQALAQHQIPACPLGDGVLLTSAQGNLVKHVNEPTWSFLLKYDSLVGKTRLKAGMRFPLLYNATFETMLADRQEYASTTYWLSAWVTRYRNRNYLFPLTFMPMRDAEPPSDEPSDSAATPDSEQASDSDTEEDRLAIPTFIKDQRRGQSPVRTRMVQTVAKVRPNRIVLDRMGFLEQQPEGPVFVYAGLGQNRQLTQIRLLPCALLESLERQQARSPERLYFKIAGLRSQYKEQPYLLLRRATRAYSYGNFKR